MKLSLVMLIVMLFLPGAVEARGVKVFQIYGDGMVLQHGKPVRISGTAAPGTEVRVTLNGGTAAAVAGADGVWRSELPPMPPGGPYEIMVTGGGAERKLRNVMFGEVWICSGQSNMEVRMYEVNSSEREIAAMNHPEIRLFQGNVYWASAEPLLDFPRSPRWSVCTPEAARNFSAVACFFAERLHRELKIPVGVVSVNWGGSRIEPWISLYGLETSPALQAEYRFAMAKKPGSAINRELTTKALNEQERWLAQAKRDAAAGKLPAAPPEYPEELRPYVMKGMGYHQKPTLVFNAMIAPLLTASFRGVLWYQGESNYQEGMLYKEKLAALMKSWRHEFKAPELPFYFAQLAPYIYKGTGRELPELWAAQQASADADLHAHMAVLTDLGELRNIHPKNKREVGIRLAELALQYEYARAIDAEFPYYESHRCNGRELIVKFRNTRALRTRDGKAPTHFEIAGTDQDFQPATARIIGPEVILTSPRVPEPRFVRFAWHQTAEPNLCGANGLPAGPFSR